MGLRSIKQDITDRKCSIKQRKFYYDLLKDFSSIALPFTIKRKACNPAVSLSLASSNPPMILNSVLRTTTDVETGSRESQAKEMQFWRVVDDVLVLCYKKSPRNS